MTTALAISDAPLTEPHSEHDLTLLAERGMPVPPAAEPTFLILRQRLARALQAAVPPLAFGLRMWAAVVLALTISFWLELDNAYWAGTSAAITCQPVLGASLRKGWFRMIGTVVGAVAAVVLTACFPQNRVEFLLGLAVWGGVCAFAATILCNFASYAAALAGFTAAIVAGDQMGKVGGVNGDAFMLAITRATEICIGIVSAGIVLAGTDFGRARHQLAATLSGLAAEITGRLIDSFRLVPSEREAMRTVRRDLIRRVGALDTVIDQAMGESPTVRFNPRPLQAAVEGLFAALSGWRIIANHLPLLPGQQAARETATIRELLPVELLSVQPEKDAAWWAADPPHMIGVFDGAIRTLVAMPAETLSLRLLADHTAEALSGVMKALQGIALLHDPGRGAHRQRVARVRVPDLLPPVLSGLRATATIGADLAPHGRGVAAVASAAADRGPIRPAAARLAPLFVRLFGVYDPAFVDGPVLTSSPLRRRSRAASCTFPSLTTSSSTRAIC